jgi:hypothetical protein
MKRHSVFAHVVAITGSLLLLGCASVGNRAGLARTGSLETFIADRPAAGDLLRAHPPLLDWFRREWERIPDGYRVAWSNEQPEHNPSAEFVIDSDRRLTVIRISAKLSPPDQIVALCFELCNAQAHTKYEAVCSRALSKTLSRDEFVEQFGIIEYGTVLRVKECVPRLLPLSSSQVAMTSLYCVLADIPGDFQAYKVWSRSHSSNYRLDQESYAAQYDELMKWAALHDRNENGQPPFR